MSTIVVCLATFLFGCGEDTSTDIQETAQAVGDMMASVDESGGSTGSLAFMQIPRWPNYLKIDTLPKIPTAYAASCLTSTTFGSCTNNVITRTFGGCSIGSITLTGTVTLTYSDASVDSTCQMTTSGHSITRNPNFTMEGRRGATLAVTKTGSNGQVITKGSGSTFSFSNDGIRRVFTSSSDSTLFDFTTQTTSNITITGTSRAGRTLSGGTLRVTNNLTRVICDYVPSDVTWTSSCNCPTSGTWSGTCSDGTSTTLIISSCGKARFAIGTESETVTFDRCYGS